MSTEYVPTPGITKGVPEFPVFAGLLGSINVIVLASIVPSSVSFAPIVVIVIGVSSRVKSALSSSTATGASLIPVTVISNVLDADKSPSLIV